jgi:hypothetical protein
MTNIIYCEEIKEDMIGDRGMYKTLYSETKHGGKRLLGRSTSVWTD